jgi:AraC-like DNA-binding protein
MKYIDYQEHMPQGNFHFPVTYYHRSPLCPRYHMQLHWHTQYELIRILSGSFLLTLGNETRLLKKDDCVLVTGGILHGGTPQDCVYECVIFDFQRLLQESFAQTRVIHDFPSGKISLFPFPSDYSREIPELVRKLCHVLSRKRDGYELAAQGYLYLLFSQLMEQHLYEETDSGSADSSQLASLKNVLSFIAKNYSQHITLDSLARIAGMNSKYFCRYFKSLTDRTPIDYLNYYRIECACELLSTKDISIKETAISCGFNDESYFIKTFHKYKGTTPKQYLKSEFSTGKIDIQEDAL